jgi:hypothetical protein
MATYLDEDADLIRSLLARDVAVPVESQGLFVLYALIMRTKGQATSLSDVHDAWSAWKQGQDPAHRCLVPFRELDESTQLADLPYLHAIQEAARQREFCG